MCKLKESAYTKSTANILAWNHVYPKLNNSQDAIDWRHHHVLVINEEELSNGGTP